MSCNTATCMEEGETAASEENKRIAETASDTPCLMLACTIG